MVMIGNTNKLINTKYYKKSIADLIEKNNLKNWVETKAWIEDKNKNTVLKYKINIPERI